MVSRRHGVPTNRIYAWRGDARLLPAASDDAGFISVEISGGDHNAAAVQPAAQPTSIPTSSARIEITLENGRKLSVSDGVDAGFVLERGAGWRHDPCSCGYEDLACGWRDGHAAWV